MINKVILCIHFIDNSIMFNYYPFSREYLAKNFCIQKINVIKITYKSPTSNQLSQKQHYLKNKLRFFKN